MVKKRASKYDFTPALSLDIEGVEADIGSTVGVTRRAVAMSSRSDALTALDAHPRIRR
jgi:hypothetical protein